MENTPEKKLNKGVFIAVVAVILVAAAVLISVFVIKPAIDNKENTTTTSNNDNVINYNQKYEYGEYNGVKMAQEFIDILNQAETERESACKEHGTAIEIGDIRISNPEFAAYYYDEYSLQRQEVNYSIQSSGTNRTGYDIDVMPDAQKHLNKDYTWAEDFTLKAIDAVTENYQGFNKAIEEGVVLSDEDVRSLITWYSRVDTYKKLSGMETEEFFETNYGKGYTETMFKAREIMLYYKQKYEARKKEELYNSYTEEQLSANLEENKDDYTVIIGRVYPIEGEFDAVEVSKIKNEQEFLDYAKNNHPNESYNAEVKTRCFFNKKSAIRDTFGTEVADWMFSEDRVAGEVGVVQGQIYRYLVYIDTPAYLNLSRKIVAYPVDYSSLTTEADIENAYNDAKKVYDDWVAGGSDVEKLKEICMEATGVAEADARIGEYYYLFEEWIFDPARKTGDSTIINSEVGCCIIYFVEENEGDYDWKHNSREAMSEADYVEAYEADVEKNYKLKRNKSALNKVYKTINVVITRQRAEEKAREKA